MSAATSRLTLLGVSSLLATCTGVGPQAPEDPGAIRPEGIEQRMLDAAKQVAAGESPQELVDRSLGAWDRQSDKETRQLRLVSDTLPALRRVAAGERGADVRAQLAKLTAQLARRYHLDVQGFERTEERIERTAAEDKAALHSRLEAARIRYLENLSRLHEELSGVLDAVERGEGTAASEAAEELVERLDSLDGSPEILGSELSYIDSPLFARALPTLATVTPAYLDSPTSSTPVVDDTRSSEEVEVSAEIQAKADELKRDPVAIYEYVKNSFELELYAGVLKGAPETFRQQRGGPADLAAVLIALFRAAEFPARYVTGTIILDQARLANLLGAADDEALLKGLSASGIEHRPLNQAGLLAGVEMSHVWVEAYVPYGYYRGVPLGQAPKEWVPLDPGIAGTPRIQRAFGALADPLGELGLSGQSLFDQYLSSVQADLPLGTVRQRIEVALDASGQGLTYDDLLDAKTAGREAFGALPASLPYRVSQVTGEYDFLPTRHIQRVRVLARKDGAILLDYGLPAHQVVGHRVVLTYAAATELDEATILGMGGMLQTPPYLANVVPIVRVDGREVARGDAPTPLAEQHELILEVTSGRFVRRIQNRGITGNIYALALGAPSNDFEEPSEYSIEDNESQAGILLSNVARAYVNQWSEAEEELAGLLGLSLVRPVPSEVLVSNDLKVIGELGVATGLEWRGVKVDADLRAASMLNQREGASASAADDLRLLSGLHGSALEQQLLTDAFQVEAISADKALAAARDAGIEILTIDSSNLASQLPLLTANQAVIDDITDRVGRGQTVTVHATPVTRQDWIGTGYIARDPDTGESSYLLSGEVIISGGLTIVQPAHWQPGLAEAVRELDRIAPIDAERVTDGYLELFGSNDRVAVVGSFDMGAGGEIDPEPFILRACSRNGRPVRGARIALERTFGFARCYSTAAAAKTFSEAATSIAEQALGDAAVAGTYFPYAALNGLDDGEVEVITDDRGLARFFCLPDPVISNGQILLPVGPSGALTAVGLSYLRPVWSGFGGENRIVYPVQLEVRGKAAAPAFLERWQIGDLTGVATGMVTDGVLGVRLKGKFGGILGGHSISWTSDVPSDVVVHRDEPNTLDPDLFSNTVTQTDGYSWVRLFVSDHGAPHTIAAKATAAPALTREFEIFESAAPNTTEVELRLVREPESMGHQGVANSLSPVWSRFEAFVREPGGVWQSASGSVELLVTADLWNHIDPEPLSVELVSPVAIGETFRGPFAGGGTSVQVLKFRAQELDGVPPEDLPAVYESGPFQLVAEPRLRVERVLPDFSREPVSSGGLVLSGDLGVSFETWNPADYELRGRLEAHPDVGEGSLVVVPGPEHSRRFSLDGIEQPDVFALLKSEWQFSEAMFADPGNWARSPVTFPVAPDAGVGSLAFEVLAPRDETVVAEAQVFVGTARVTQVEEVELPGALPPGLAGTISLDGDHRTVREVRATYELRLPIGLAATSVSLEIADADDAVVRSFVLPAGNTAVGEMYIPSGTYLGTNQFVSARLHIDEGLPTDTVSSGQLVRLSPHPCGRCREEDGGEGITVNEFLCVQPYSLEHPASNLNPLDYYSSLGTKTVRLCVTNEAGAWGRGTLSASVEAREPGEGDGEYVAAPVDASVLGRQSGSGVEVISSGLAEFQLTAEAAVGSEVLVATFTWQPPGGPGRSAELEFRVRDNSNVSVGDVLNGTAVFVAETREPDEPDILTTPGTHESTQIPGQDATAHHFAAWSDRRADSLQFMLNQVVPRYTRAMADYHTVNEGNGLPENGKYDRSTKEALAVFRQYFGYQNDPALGDDVEALKQEYNLDDPPPEPANPLVYAGGAFDPLSIVGTYVLLRGEGGEYAEADRCFGQTSLLEPNTSCGPPDAGLFEIYENVVKPFIEAKIEAMESYVHLAAAVNEGHWHSRPFRRNGIQVRQSVPLPDDFEPGNDEEVIIAALDDGRNGVSYCYGCTQMTALVRAAFRSDPTYWGEFSEEEQGNVFEQRVSNAESPVRFGVEDEDEVADLLPQKYAGLTQDELIAWAGSFGAGEDANLQYAPKYWAGIDCSGSVWLSAEYAVRSSEDLRGSIHGKWPTYSGNLFDDAGRLLGKRDYSVQSMAEHSYLLRADVAPDDARFWTHSSTNVPRHADDRRTLFAWGQRVHVPLRFSIRRGDLVLIPGHIGAVYSDGEIPERRDENAAIRTVEASGTDVYRVGRGAADVRFGRKAIVRNLIHYSGRNWRPRMAIREILWQ